MENIILSISEINTEGYWQQIEGIILHAKPTKGKELALEVGVLYNKLLKELTNEKNQYFPGTYHRQEYLIDYYQIPDKISKGMRVIGFHLKKLRQVEKYIPSLLDLQRMVKGQAELVAFFSGSQIPEPIDSFFKDIGWNVISDQENETYLPDLDFFVTHIGEKQVTKDGKRKYFKLKGRIEKGEGYAVSITFWKEFVYLQSRIWQYSRIRITDLKLSDNQSNEDNILSYEVTKSSLVSLDPDFLMDASIIAKCAVKQGIDPTTYLAQKFKKNYINYYFMRGNMVNEYLDHKLSGEAISPEKLFAKVLNKYPLYSLIFDQNSFLRICDEVSLHCRNLDLGYIYHPDSNSKKHHLEPTFLSEKFGVKGRLDVLEEDTLVSDRKSVVELKTSKDPRPYCQIQKEHEIQGLVYDLMMRSINIEHQGDTSILYSSVPPTNDPRRNIVTDTRNHKMVLGIRNFMAFYEWLLMTDSENALQLLINKKFSNVELWESDQVELNQILSAIDKANELEKVFFFTFCQFVAREHRAAKVGASNSKDWGREGFSAMWNQGIDYKRKTFNVYANLIFHTIEVKEGNVVVTFKIHEEEIEKKYVSGFRKGDILLLYGHDQPNELKPTHQQIIKASVKEIHSDRISLSPFNTFLDKFFFESRNYWAAEPELFEDGYKVMYESLFDFLSASKDKRELLLGQKMPVQTPEIPDLLPCYDKEIQLKEVQETQLKNMLRSSQYYLLQGPPGTGKTKVIIRELVRNLLKNPTERILLLAYTNRAVDELCEALYEAIEEPFYRLGHHASTENESLLLSEAVRGKRLEEIKGQILSCRVFVSTLITFQKNPQLEKSISFSTAIIDEASQILEPQIIGILAKVSRFVMIGDEKQLPAVVVQNEVDLKTEDLLLNQMGIHRLDNSLFERLLKQCKVNGWNHAYGSLEDQARMHEAIAVFPNQTFYEGRLATILPEQLFGTEGFWGKSNSTFLTTLNQKRNIFLNVEAENRGNRNILEAKVVAELIREFKGILGDKKVSIGIITPFRAQIALIRQEIGTSQLSDNLTIDTVERFQGGQRDIIIISTAVNHPSQLQRLEVLNEEETVDRKLNVALTRAKQYLIMVGVGGVLVKGKFYGQLMEHYSKNKAIFNAVNLLTPKS